MFKARLVTTDGKECVSKIISWEVNSPFLVIHQADGTVDVIPAQHILIFTCESIEKGA